MYQLLSYFFVKNAIIVLSRP